MAIAVSLIRFDSIGATNTALRGNNSRGIFVFNKSDHKDRCDSSDLVIATLANLVSNKSDHKDRCDISIARELRPGRLEFPISPITRIGVTLWTGVSNSIDVVSNKSDHKDRCDSRLLKSLPYQDYRASLRGSILYLSIKRNY